MSGSTSGRSIPNAIGRVVALGVLLMVGVVAPAGLAGADRVRPEVVFERARSLAIEAARARLGEFVAANPAPAPGTEAPPPSVACPLASVDTISTAAAALNASRSVSLQPQLDPWVAATSSNPELRPDSTPSGEVGGLPIVRCTTTRPADGAITRPELFAISPRGGVSFADVARLYALDPVLRVQPATIGGEMVGSCLATATTASCVVLWQSRSLVLGLTLEGPPASVNTSTAGVLLADLVPDIVDTLAVVKRAPLACNRDAIAAATGIALLAEPECHDGWAFGRSIECPPPDPPASSTTTTTTLVPGPCDTLDVFHVERDGWKHNGLIDIRCAENLVRLSMTAVTAQKVAPICDEDDPSLRGGTIRPDTEGPRVSALQIALVNLGYDMPVDGRYGPITEAAVVDFQVAGGLIVDGVTGSQTRDALGI